MPLARNWVNPRQTIASTSRGELVPLSAGMRRFLAVAIFAAAISARLAYFPREAAMPFITFFPAVALSALLFGAGAGVITLVLCAVAAYYILLAPAWTFSVPADQIFAILIFTASGLVVCFLAQQMQRRTRELREALKEREDLYENAPCGYHSLDSNGIYVRVNDAELKLLGYRRDEVIGKLSFRDLLTPASLPRFEATFPIFKRTGLVKDLEFELRRKNGSIVPILLSATAIVDSEGRYVMSRSTVYDITERQRAEDVQRRLSRALRLLSECSMELVRADSEQALLDAICRLIVQTGGYLMAWVGLAENDEQKTARPIASSGFEQGYLEGLEVSADEALATGRGPTGTAVRTGTTQVNPNCLGDPKMGPWRDSALKRGYQSNIALPLIIRGQTIGALTIYAAEAAAFTAEEVALLEEMTRELTFGIQILRTRAQHAAAELQLEVSEERLQLALYAANMGIFDFDIAAGKLACDARARELWGIGHNETATYAMFMAGVHPDDWPATRAAIDLSLDSTGSGEYNIHYRVLSRADESERYVSASGRVFFERGRAVRSIGVVKDISAQKRLERAEQERQSELELISRQQVAAQTAAAIAHELNQPLISVSVYSGTALQMLRRGKANPEKLEHALQGAVDQAQRAGRTLHELIAFLHKGEGNVEPIDLNELLREASAISAQNSPGKFRPTLELDPSLPKVLANRFQVQKVLLNLLLNSTEALAQVTGPAPLGGIKIKTAEAGNMAQVTVQDGGPGLDEETAMRIFDPFFTTKPHGMGLGLAISRALIEALGGKLWTDPTKSTPGATFHFTLPFSS